jgi:hypothetical protein
MLRAIFRRLENIKNLQKIWDPKGIEKIASASFFLSVVLPKVKELKDVSVPRLNVDSEGARTLIATLVYITSSCIVGSQHRYDSVGVAVSSGNI